METEIKELEHQIELKVTLPTEQVDAAIQKTLRRLSERVNIAGFRRGKAPLGMVRTHVGEERLREDALELLVDESLEEAYHQREIQPLFAPELDIEQFEPGKALIYKVVIDPWPKLDLPDVTEVDVRVDPIRVGDEDTEKALERLRESYAEYSPKEGSAGTGDAVVLHWRLSGKDPWRTDMIELGKEALVAGFDEKVEGIQAGEEREFVLPVQEQELTFFVQAMEIKRKHLPDVDDSLAGKLGADTLDGLKEKIRTELLTESQRRHDQKLAGRDPASLSGADSDHLFGPCRAESARFLCGILPGALGEVRPHAGELPARSEPDGRGLAGESGSTAGRAAV